MKKRSLFAAVAMLIVSALVLTSATYAWFAQSQSATFATFTSSVDKQSSGAITISADGIEWKTSLAVKDYYVLANGASDVTRDSTTNEITNTLKATCNGNYFPYNLEAVSFAPATQNVPAVSGAYSGTEFTAQAANGGYVAYAIKLRADAACTVRVTLTASQSASPFIWAAMKCGGNTVIVNGTPIVTPGANEGDPDVTTARSYLPITSFVTADTTHPKPIDNNNSWTVDTVEATGSNVTLGTAVQASNTTNSAYIDYVFSAEGETTVTVYEWAEGQDIACNGSVQGTCNLGVTFAVQ